MAAGVVTGAFPALKLTIGPANGTADRPVSHPGTRMRALRLILSILLLAGAAAGSAAADSMRYLSFDASSESARWRTGDVTLAIRRSLMGARRIDVLFRRKGSDLPLLPSDAPFQVAAIAPLIGDHDADGVRLYSVDPKAGAKFMPIACEGLTQKAWVAISEPRPYKPLAIWVFRWDEAARAPVLCVAMDYRFRGEWKMPPAANRAREESPYYRSAN